MPRNPLDTRETTARRDPGEAGCCEEGGCAHAGGRTRTETVPAAAHQRVELSLEGVSGDRREAAARALREAEGVTEALFNPIMTRAVLEFDPAATRIEALVRCLEARGAAAGERLTRWHVPLPGLACGRCAARIEEEIGRLPGVHGATVNRATESLTLECTPARVAPAAVRAILASRGFH